MLLRRVSEHVKGQSWTAVAIDFLIVVVGILIAFQITQWNEARKAGEREAYVVAQLAADMRTIEQLAEEYVEVYRGKVAAADRVMAFVASGHWLVDNLQRIVPEAAGRTLPESCETAPR